MTWIGFPSPGELVLRLRPKPERVFAGRVVFLALLLSWTLGNSPRALAFGFEDVDAKAKQLAAAPFRQTGGVLPTELSSDNLSYDLYRDIRFKPALSLWRGDDLSFETAFFHQGRYFNLPVKINEVKGNVTQPLKFDPEQFDYGKNKFDPNRLRNLGFAGFRIHYPLNRKNYKDEVLAFLGASYFRALGKSQRYGVSARGLAVDTALNSGEEFPRFVEFWLVRPEPEAKELTLYALLDSPRVSGAYRFVLRPGADTTMEVKARVYLRDAVGLLGLAPLTSMFLFGENQAPATEDYRPEVHDSDGLSIRNANGEWIWRPLQNPKRLLVTSFALRDPAGFGLMQRDRKFHHYEDTEAHYQDRPSVWVEPLGRWGSGRIELVQIPVKDETNDNVVAYWVPEKLPPPRQALDFEYRLHWQGDGPRPANAWVAQSRRGHGYRQQADDSVAFMVDFDGPGLEKIAADAKPQVQASTDANGQILEAIPIKNEATDAWRLSLRLRRLDPAKATEIRAQLLGVDNLPSEIWSYVLPPE